MNAIKSLAFQSAIALCLTTSFVNSSPAQMFPVMSQQAPGALATPVPAAYHPRTRAVFLGSGAAVRTMEHGTTGRLASRGDIPVGAGDTILRLRVDTRRDRLWILDIGTVRVFDLLKNRLIASITLPNWIFAESDNCLPDLQLDHHGAAFVSEVIQPKLWRVDPDDFSVKEHAIVMGSHTMLDVGFSALAITEQGVMFAAMAAPGLLWRVDTRTGRAENIPLSVPLYGACALESQRAAGSRDAILVALTARRGALDIRRVSIAPARGVALVDVLPTRPTAVYATMLKSNGGLFVAAKTSTPIAMDRQKARRQWVLSPITPEG